MDINKINTLSRKIVVGITILGVVLLFQSCARKLSFSNSSVVPAAEGYVKIKKDRNSNYSIDLKTIRLADPQKLDPPKDVYVVWMETEQHGTKNIGQLNTSSSLLSKTLKSSLKTVTSFNPTGFFITAEDNSNIQYPGIQVVLKTASLR